MEERTSENRNQGPLCKSGLKRQTHVHELMDYRKLKEEIEAGVEYFWSRPHRQGCRPLRIETNDFLFK